MSAELPPVLKTMHADVMVLIEKWCKLPESDAGQAIGVLLGTACGLAVQAGYTKEQVATEVAKIMGGA